MKALSTLVLSLAVILNSIELSSLSEGSRNGAPTLGSSRAGTSHSSGRNHSPGRSRSRTPPDEFDPAGFHHARLPPVEYDPAWFPPSEFDPEGIHYAWFHPAEYPPYSPCSPGKPPSKPLPPARSSPSRPPPSLPRIMVPPTRLPSRHKNGCGLKNFKFIRLTSKTNRLQTFELRRYTFPADKGLKLRIRDNVFEPVPTQEQIVISTADGDIFAILESTNVLAGIYICDWSNGVIRRAKINMESGTVTTLTKEEVNETPVGPRRPIRTCFRINLAKEL